MDQTQLRQIACWLLNAADTLDQKAAGPYAAPLLRCGLHLALQAARLQRIADGYYTEPERHFQKAIAALEAVHTALGVIPIPAAEVAAATLRAHLDALARVASLT